MTTRTTTPIERAILRWMERNTEKISAMAIHRYFNIEVDEAVFMIRVFNLNPDSDYEEIRVS